MIGANTYAGSNAAANAAAAAAAAAASAGAGGSNDILDDGLGAGSGKTGLEDKPKRDWMGTLYDGINIGLGFLKPKPPVTTAPSGNDNTETEKILGMPKPVFYGVTGLVVLITGVIVVKKMKK